MHLSTVATKSSSITVHQGSPFICFIFSLGIPSSHKWMSARKTALQINSLLGIYIFRYCIASIYYYYMHYLSLKMNKVSVQQKPPCVYSLYDQNKPATLPSVWEFRLETGKPLEDRKISFIALQSKCNGTGSWQAHADGTRPRQPRTNTRRTSRTKQPRRCLRVLSRARQWQTTLRVGSLPEKEKSRTLRQRDPLLSSVKTFCLMFVFVEEKTRPCTYLMFAFVIKKECQWSLGKWNISCSPKHRS